MTEKTTKDDKLVEAWDTIVEATEAFTDDHECNEEGAQHCCNKVEDLVLAFETVHDAAFSSTERKTTLPTIDLAGNVAQKRLRIMRGTSLQAHLACPYEDIVATFGPPNTAPVDDSATDVEWAIQTPWGFMSIYNWKDGKAYLGEDGEDVKDIEDWNVGAHDQVIVNMLIEHFDHLNPRSTFNS